MPARMLVFVCVRRLRRLVMRRRPFLFQSVKRIFVRVIPLRQFRFVEIVRRIAVTKFGIAQDILFGLVVSGFIGIGSFLFCHFYRF